MKRVLVAICVFVAAGTLFWFFPLFHVVAVDRTGADAASEVNAAEFANAFWNDRLVPAFERAADAATVAAALRESPEEARRQFGRAAGLGRATLFFVKGSGVILSVNEQNVGVAFASDAVTPEIVLPMGLTSGNTVRDASGLLTASDYPNSQQFNEISTQLNRIVDRSVIPKLKQAAQIGRRIEFVGCARVLNLPSDAQPLKVIPLYVRVSDAP